MDKVQVPRDWQHEETWNEIVENSGTWFNKDSMRFFRTRISWGSLIKTGRGYAFITSEKNVTPYQPPMPRAYTLREWVRSEGVINTIGDFQGFPTARDARIALHTLIALGL